MPAEPADSLRHCSAIKCLIFLPAHYILSVHGMSLICLPVLSLIFLPACG